jgi:lipid-binding SYLF domain-containing protein
MMLADTGMKRRQAFLAFGAALLAAPFAEALTAPAAYAQTSQQVTIAGARKVLVDLRHDKAFGNARTLLREAKAVLIVPKLVKGGFFVGGEGGDGVIMVRRGRGWSSPAFYALGAASFGLQVGLEQSEVIMLLMTQKAVEGVLHDQFKIGAQAGLSVVTLGSGVEGAIGGATPPDVVVWSSSTGLYGGLTVDGSIIKSEPEETAKFYGRSVTPRQVLYGSVTNQWGDALRRDIGVFG